MNLGIGGKRAAVAAASRGLGFGVAAALAAEGVHVAMCGRHRDTIEEAARHVGADAVPLVADVATPASAAGTFATTELEQYQTAIELNCLSVIAMCDMAVPAMQARGWGRVVAITSIAVRQPIAELILSNTARAGVTGFLKTLAREVAADGVTVNSLQPGLHDTERVRDLHGGDTSTVAGGVPVGALGRADDFGAVAAFVCSERARFLTGAAIPVDGGTHAGLL